MKNTVDDFWLMIWQQGVEAIVMITNIIERGKVNIITLFIYLNFKIIVMYVHLTREQLLSSS